MSLQGCTPGKHTSSADLPTPKPVQTGPGAGSSSTPAVAMKMVPESTETFSSGPAPGAPSIQARAAMTLQTTEPPPPPPPTPAVEDEDDADVPVESGTKCLRTGCRHAFVGQEESRGPQSKCIYHPKPVGATSLLHTTLRLTTSSSRSTEAHLPRGKQGEELQIQNTADPTLTTQTQRDTCVASVVYSNSTSS